MVNSGTRASVSTGLRENYDSYYDGESEWRVLGAKYKAMNIDHMCERVPHSTVLDIGAGEGSVSVELIRTGFSSNISCLEISQSGVAAIAERQIPEIKEAAQFDGYESPYPDRHFDLAISSHVLEHVEHERIFLAEAGRVAEHLFLEVPLEDTFRLGRDYRPSRVGHINFYNFKTFRRLIQTSGFEIVDQILFETPLEVISYSKKLKGTLQFALRTAADRISRSGASRLFTYHCGILCRRT